MDTEVSVKTEPSIKAQKMGHIEHNIPMLKKVELFATVTRADGTVEELGMIATSEQEG